MAQSNPSNPSNPYTIDMEQFANDLEPGNRNPGSRLMQLKDGNSENPSVYNDEAPSNPSSRYKVNLALVKKLQSDRQAVAEAEPGIENQWYKVKNL